MFEAEKRRAENEFESTFTTVAACVGTTTTKRNNAFNSGLFKRLNKTKLKSHDWYAFTIIAIIWLL